MNLPVASMTLSAGVSGRIEPSASLTRVIRFPSTTRSLFRTGSPPDPSINVARQDAGPARPHARRHGRATTNRRTPVWDPQGVDGRHPLPDPDPRQGPNRDEPPRSGL